MTPVVVPEKSNIIYDLSQSFLVGVCVHLERGGRDIDNREMHEPWFTEMFLDKIQNFLYNVFFFLRDMVIEVGESEGNVIWSSVSRETSDITDSTQMNEITSWGSMNDIENLLQVSF